MRLKHVAGGTFLALIMFCFLSHAGLKKFSQEVCIGVSVENLQISEKFLSLFGQIEEKQNSEIQKGEYITEEEKKKIDKQIDNLIEEAKQQFEKLSKNDQEVIGSIIDKSNYFMSKRKVSLLRLMIQKFKEYLKNVSIKKEDYEL